MSFCLVFAGGNVEFSSKIGKPYQKIAGKSLIEINETIDLSKLKRLFLFTIKKTRNE